MSTLAAICARAERHVPGHLVAVEVALNACRPRVDLDWPCLDEDWLEGWIPRRARGARGSAARVSRIDVLEEVPHLGRCCSTISLAP